MNQEQEINNMRLIKEAVYLQTKDEGIWFRARYMPEHYLQESLRDLHLVIEHGDIEAMKRIKERADTSM
jgi:hypothetical protein